MILAALASALALASAPSINTVAAVTPMHCRGPGVRLIDTPKRSAYNRLADLPPADLHLLVDRRINGCAVPVIVVKDVEQSLSRPAPRPVAPNADAPKRRP